MPIFFIFSLLPLGIFFPFTCQYFSLDAAFCRRSLLVLLAFIF
jgi:hypothetical protein